MRSYRNHLRPLFSRTAGRIVDADLARPFLPDKGQSSLDYPPPPLTSMLVYVGTTDCLCLPAGVVELGDDGRERV